MSEIYTGPKFKTIFIKKEELVSEHLEELIGICEIFQQKGLTPFHESGTAGNLSFRIENSNEFIISAAGLTQKNKLKNSDFVLVKNCNEKDFLVEVVGTKNPSSETFMHNTIYSNSLEINSVFHGHNNLILEKASELGIATTTNYCEYGSIELAESIKDLIKKHSFFILKDHGFISVGTNMQEAKEQAIYFLEKAKGLI